MYTEVRRCNTKISISFNKNYNTKKIVANFNIEFWTGICNLKHLFGKTPYDALILPLVSWLKYQRILSHPRRPEVYSKQISKSKEWSFLPSRSLCVDIWQRKMEVVVLGPTQVECWLLDYDTYFLMNFQHILRENVRNT